MGRDCEAIPERSPLRRGREAKDQRVTAARSLNGCVAEGFLERTPFPRRLLPRIQERPAERFTDEEVERLSRLPEPYGFVCRLGIGTGLRWGELARATSADVKDNMLTVHRTKTGKLRRVPISCSLRDELRLRIGPLIPFRHGDSFTRQVRKLSGVEGFHPHRMRHTFACRWLERGGNLSALQRALGHASIVTTERYARLTDEHVRAEAEADRRDGGKFDCSFGSRWRRRLAENLVSRVETAPERCRSG